MNKQQKQYAICKARVDTLHAEADEIERAYIEAHNIVNDDGTRPRHVWMIGDDTTAEAAIENTSPAIDALGISAAEEDLRKAEDALITYGLSIAPAATRATLEGRCFGSEARVTIRKKVIDSAFRLDTRTVPALIS